MTYASKSMNKCFITKLMAKVQKAYNSLYF